MERCSKWKFAPELWFRLHRFRSAWPQNSAMTLNRFFPERSAQFSQENPKCVSHTCIPMLSGIGA